MQLEGPQVEQLQAALLDAFPDEDRLGRMLRFKVGVRLDVIAVPGNLESRVDDVIKWAEGSDQVLSLVIGALAARPSNRQLQEFTQQHLVDLVGALVAEHEQHAAGDEELELVLHRPTHSPALWAYMIAIILIVVLTASVIAYFVVLPGLRSPHPFQTIQVEPAPLTSESFAIEEAVSDLSEVAGQRCVLKVESQTASERCGGTEINLWAARTCMIRVVVFHLPGGEVAKAERSAGQYEGPPPLSVSIPACEKGDQVLLVVGIYDTDSTQLPTTAKEWKKLITVGRKP